MKPGKQVWEQEGFLEEFEFISLVSDHFPEALGLASQRASPSPFPGGIYTVTPVGCDWWQRVGLLPSQAFSIPISANGGHILAPEKKHISKARS